METITDLIAQIMDFVALIFCILNELLDLGLVVPDIPCLD